MSKPKTHPRARLLAALFAKVNKAGVPQEELRDAIAPAVLKGKRLSEASLKEILMVIEHVVKLYPSLKTARSFDSSTGSLLRVNGKRYPASLAGLKQEIEDIAKARYGVSFEGPLNALCNSFGAAHYRWLDLRTAKALKKRLMELSNEDAGTRDSFV